MRGVMTMTASITELKQFKVCNRAFEIALTILKCLIECNLKVSKIKVALNSFNRNLN